MSSSRELRHKCHVVLLSKVPHVVLSQPHPHPRLVWLCDNPWSKQLQQLQLWQNAYYISMNSVSEAAQPQRICGMLSQGLGVFECARRGLHQKSRRSLTGRLGCAQVEQEEELIANKLMRRCVSRRATCPRPPKRACEVATLQARCCPGKHVPSPCFPCKARCQAQGQVCASQLVTTVVFAANVHCLACPASHATDMPEYLASLTGVKFAATPAECCAAPGTAFCQVLCAGPSCSGCTSFLCRRCCA